jgi:hypothetical protein
VQKKGENCWCRLEGSSTGSKWASGRAQEGLGERKKSSTMLVQAQASEAQAARGFWEGAQAQKVENCWCRLEGSSTGSRWASGRAQEGLGERKKSSTMLVQAQASEAQAARGFWGRPRHKKSKIAGADWRGGAHAAGVLLSST